MDELKEINREIENKQRLLSQHYRRLQVLKEQKAQFGLSVPPHIVTEIAEIETELEPLQVELYQLRQEQELLQAPVVYIANLGSVPADLPLNAIVVDWSGEFVFDPRQVPAPERWQAELWPELFQLPARVGRTGLIRLQGSSSLSTAFAFGQVFRNVGGYRLAVEQRSPNQTTTWYANVEPPAGERAVEFISRMSALNPAGQDGLVIIYAAPQTTLAAVVGEIGDYWGEADTFRQVASDLSVEYVPRQAAKAALVLEDKAATHGEHLVGWQAAALARTSRRKLIEFIEQVQPERLHLFLAGPVGLAAFIGHYWNQVGLEIQCYERLSRNRYAPSFVLKARL